MTTDNDKQKQRFPALTKWPDKVKPIYKKFFYYFNYISIVAALIHVAFIFLFLWLDVMSLVYFNFLSVTVWILCYLLNKKGVSLMAAIIGGAEIMAHQGFCVYIMGWDAGFQYLLFGSVAGIFLMPQKVKILKVIFVGSNLAVFIALFFFAKHQGPINQLAPEILTVLYLTNISTTILILGVIGASYSSASTKVEYALEKEYQRSEDLLHNILPVEIAERLKSSPGTIADGFEEVTVLFADIVNFTELSEEVSPAELVMVLNEVFSSFDEIAERYGVEKIKTIGDAYMAVCGLPTLREDHADVMADMALDMTKSLRQLKYHGDRSFTMRIGINSGPVVAGVIGRKKFIYDLWGDTVNMASRMESHGLGGSIQVTEASYNNLKDKYIFEERGLVDIKGKGKVNCYILKSKKG